MLIREFPTQAAFAKMAADCNVIPVCTEILADTETPVSLLQKIIPGKDPLFLFESVQGGEQWGRYSFMGTSSNLEIVVYHDVVEIQNGSSIDRKPHLGNPFLIIREFMSRYHAASLPELPRFWGGLVGYLAYEIISFFEPVPHNLPKDRPLARFMLPDLLYIFDNVRHTLQIVSISFLEDNDNPKDAFRDARKRIDDALKLVQSNPPAQNSLEPPSVGALCPVEDPGTFRKGVRKVKEDIRNGEIIQAVISQPFVCTPAPNPLSLYRAQRYINPSPYLFYLKTDGMTLIGSSPETMVRLENGIASLRPIAGTRPRGTSEQEDRSMASELLSDEKEKAEHLMLVDLGRNDLGRVAEIGTVQVTDLMVVERYSHVMHLVSNIICDMKEEFDAWDLLSATFPAGTLSGAPKIRAMQIIADIETEPRGPYGGAVGYISFNGNMDMAITIRTAILEEDRLTVRAGAGIVADSDPEKERIETVNKAKAIEKALELISGKEQKNDRGY